MCERELQKDRRGGRERPHYIIRTAQQPIASLRPISCHDNQRCPLGQLSDEPVSPNRPDSGFKLVVRKKPTKSPAFARRLHLSPSQSSNQPAVSQSHGSNWLETAVLTHTPSLPPPPLPPPPPPPPHQMTEFIVSAARPTSLHSRREHAPNLPPLLCPHWLPPSSSLLLPRSLTL